MTDTYAKAAIGYERIREVLEIERDVKDMPGPRPAPNSKARLNLKNVGFHYIRIVRSCKNVSFSIEQGK